jgi:hypothetical protein
MGARFGFANFTLADRFSDFLQMVAAAPILPKSWMVCAW